MSRQHAVTLLRPVIGLTGAKGVGKDTLARVLQRERGAHLLAFADPMRAALYDTNPYVVSEYGIRSLQSIVDSVGWDVAKRRYKEVRRMLQTYGVAVRDHIGDSTWVDLARDEAWARLAEGTPVVFTDVRFENEARLVRERFGGRVVRIVRHGYGGDDPHVSERESASLAVDHTVENHENDPDVAAETLLSIFDTSRALRVV